ncbi:MAG: hypothetical protein AAF085_15810, partial [Planctomycetota bacterium]
AADRARDERLKLARLVKHSSELPVSQPTATDSGATPDARFVALSQQVEQLEQKVAEKLQALDQVQENIDSRSQYLEELRHTITDTTRAFVTQVEQAQHFKAHVDAAKQHVKMSAGRVVEDIRQHLSEYEGPIAKRIEELTAMDEQIDKRVARMQQMHKQASEAVDKHLLGALRTAKEQAGDLAQPVKEQVDQHLIEQAKKIEDAIQTKIGELDVDVEEALAPLTERFNAIVAEAQGKAESLAQGLPERLEAMAVEQIEKVQAMIAEKAEEISETQDQADLLGETLPDRLETLAAEQIAKVQAELSEKITQMQASLDKQADELAEGLDDKALNRVGKRVHDRIAQSLDSYLAEADEQAGGYVDGLIVKLDEAREQAGGYVDGLVVKLDEAREQALADFQSSVQKIEADSSMDREEMIARLQEEASRLSGLADERLAHAQGVIEDASDNIHQKASAIVESALRAADAKIEDYESTAVNQIRLFDEGIDHSIEQSRQRLREFEIQAGKRRDDAIDVADRAIQQAQERIAKFEAGIAQRIGNATQTVDDSIQVIDQRMHRVEQDASARVMQIVDLAEESGRSVAESITALSKAAEATAAQAQADLDEKLNAFEVISAEALKTSEETLRANISELRESSRVMIEVVTKQVKAQAAEIEPQTAEVITQAEQTMRRRLSELREGAQSMVDIMASRLESQINAVKTKAQHAAFKGVDGENQANDAA